MSTADDYERAEAAYLQALRERADSQGLATCAKAVSDAAKEWAAAAYREFFAMRDTLGRESQEVIEQEIRAEKAEMLQELWADISSAHGT